MTILVIITGLFSVCFKVSSLDPRCSSLRHYFDNFTLWNVRKQFFLFCLVLILGGCVCVCVCARVRAGGPTDREALVGTPRHACPTAWWCSGGNQLQDPNCGLTSQGKRLRFGNEKEFGGGAWSLSPGEGSGDNLLQVQALEPAWRV